MYMSGKRSRSSGGGDSIGKIQYLLKAILGGGEIGAVGAATTGASLATPSIADLVTPSYLGSGIGTVAPQTTIPYASGVIPQTTASMPLSAPRFEVKRKLLDKLLNNSELSNYVDELNAQTKVQDWLMKMQSQSGRESQERGFGFEKEKMGMDLTNKKDFSAFEDKIKGGAESRAQTRNLELGNAGVLTGKGIMYNPENADIFNKIISDPAIKGVLQDILEKTAKSRFGTMQSEQASGILGATDQATREAAINKAQTDKILSEGGLTAAPLQNKATEMRWLNAPALIQAEANQATLLPLTQGSQVYDTLSGKLKYNNPKENLLNSANNILGNNSQMNNGVFNTLQPDEEVVNINGQMIKVKKVRQPLLQKPLF